MNSAPGTFKPLWGMQHLNLGPLPASAEHQVEAFARGWIRRGLKRPGQVIQCQVPDLARLRWVQGHVHRQLQAHYPKKLRAWLNEHAFVLDNDSRLIFYRGGLVNGGLHLPWPDDNLLWHLTNQAGANLVLYPEWLEA